MDAQLPNTNVPEESKPSEPNQQLSDTDLNAVVGGVKPTEEGNSYFKIHMEDALITSIE